MKIAQGAFLFAMLGVASARVGKSVNNTDQGKDPFIEIEFVPPTNTIVTPDGGLFRLDTTSPPDGGFDRGLSFGIPDKGIDFGFSTLGVPNGNVRVNIGYKNDQGKLKALAMQANELINDFKTVNAITTTIPRVLLDVLANDPDIDFVEEDGAMEAFDFVPYGIPQAQADSARLPPASSTSGACNDPNSFKVAVIDSGLEVAHPDLPCRSIYDSDTNCKGISIGINDEPWYAPKDKASHGTHVFGTIAAIGGNDVGITSMNPDSGGICYLTARVFNDAMNGQYISIIYEAVDWALDEGADVINMSLGGGGYSSIGQSLFNEAHRRGAIVVSAAGNTGSTSKAYPASYENVISVAAVDDNKKTASFSQSNNYVDISAAGVRIASTFLDGRYVYASGTSMATPHVTGAVARIWSTCRSCTSVEVEQCLLSTAEDLGPVGRDNDYGEGLLQTQDAYDCLIQSCCGAPSSSPSASPSLAPSGFPSDEPSSTLSSSPSSSPSVYPSALPSSGPSSSPSAGPSVDPSAMPSTAPSVSPSATPSESPSVGPSLTPSTSPSAVPSASPSVAPSASPSAVPSAIPSAAPSSGPTTTTSPTTPASPAPSAGPTTTPSPTASAGPSGSPSARPSVSPSSTTSIGPSVAPTESPSTVPSFGPSTAPSATPSAAPSQSPSAAPSMTYSASPSAVPSTKPSDSPSSFPSSSPSLSPTVEGEEAPSEAPSSFPSTSEAPSFLASASPSAIPSASASISPTSQPTCERYDYEFPIDLGSACNYAILAKTGISTVPTSDISGDIAVSPIASGAMTGFALTLDASTQFSTSSQLTGKAFAASYTVPTPGYLTTAVTDMHAAYNDAAARSNNDASRKNIGAGSIGGQTFSPGVYSFSAALTIATDITFEGGPDDVFIIQVETSLYLTAGMHVLLAGCAQAKNIFWVVKTSTYIGADATMRGTILGATAVDMLAGSVLEGNILTQTRANLGKATIRHQDTCATPSQSPTVGPSLTPSMSLSAVPSASPSTALSASPSADPSAIPSAAPSAVLTTTPSPTTSAGPSGSPSAVPSVSPSSSPSASPSVAPSTLSSSSPSESPSTIPSLEPSTAPSSTPSAAPSHSPSGSPSAGPSVSPSSTPSAGPSDAPSTSPSSSPSESPSTIPSLEPSTAPSSTPSAAPSHSPSAGPSGFPSAGPSVSPSSTPSAAPSFAPSTSPSSTPSELPSAIPSLGPSTTPSSTPSAAPSQSPSSGPSGPPTAVPSVLPSFTASAGPSVAPTESPSTIPSFGPSSAPSSTPSAAASQSPSAAPSMTDSVSPSVVPSTKPSDSPSSFPSSSPSLDEIASSESPSSFPSTSEAPSFLASASPSAMPSASPSIGPPIYEFPVDLGSACNYAIIAKTGISTVPTSDITGDIAVSPIAAGAITGFALTLDASTQFSTSSQLTGKAFAASYTVPTPGYLTTAVVDMHAAYNKAAARPNNDASRKNIGAGSIGGQTFSPGVYSFSAALTIATDITFEGGPDDVFIIQVETSLYLTAGMHVLLAGGAQAKNIFWVVKTSTYIGADATMRGTILGATAVDMLAGSVLEGNILTQTRANLGKATIRRQDTCA